MRRIISRPVPDKLPETALPVYVRSVGYNEATLGWREFFPARKKSFAQIFWCVKGAGDFKMGCASHRLRSDEIIYRLPGEDHVHAAASPLWAYHWFTLDGPLAAEFLLGYGYPQKPMPAGPCPVELFLQLESLMREMSPRSQRRMLSVATEILARAGDFNERSGRSQEVVERFLELAGSNFSNQTVNVNAIADMLGVHRTTLDRLFKRQMRMRPNEYLVRLRLQHALSLLRETDLPVCEVGDRCGIPNRGYFCKLIRKATGATPKTYREKLPVM